MNQYAAVRPDKRISGSVELTCCYCLCPEQVTTSRAGVGVDLGILKALPELEVTSEHLERARALITISSRAGSCTYAAYARRGVTTTTLPAILSELERDRPSINRPPLLLSPYLTPAVTERLLTERVEFADGAGNAFLNSPATYVLVLGHKPDRTLRPDGFTVTGLKLIYALLSSPALRRVTQRDLAAAAGVSLGKVSATLRQLEAAGYLYRVKSGALHLYEPAQLLGRCEFGYLEQLRPKLAPSSWRLGKNATLEDTLTHATTVLGVLVGGEVAADAFARYLVARSAHPARTAGEGEAGGCSAPATLSGQGRRRYPARAVHPASEPRRPKRSGPVSRREHSEPRPSASGTSRADGARRRQVAEGRRPPPRRGHPARAGGHECLS